MLNTYIAVAYFIPMARSKQSKAARKRFANRKEAVLLPIPPLQPLEQSSTPLEPLQLSSTPLEPLQLFSTPLELPQLSLPPIEPPQLSLPPIEPPHLSSTPLEPPEQSLPATEPMQSSLLEPTSSELSHLSLPLKSLQSPIQEQAPSLTAIEQLQKFNRNTSYTFTPTHSPHLVQPIDTLEDNALTLTQEDINILLRNLQVGNVWRNNLEGFSAFERFERGPGLQNVKNVSNN